MSFLNYNGKILESSAALFTIQNAAFRHGTSLIETLLWQNGNVRLFHLHTARLQAGLQQLGMPVLPGQQWHNAIRETWAANGQPARAMIRCQFFPALPELSFVIECTPLDNTSCQEGLRIGISNSASKNADALSALKTSSRLAYSVAMQEAAAQGWQDVLLINAAGRIVESTICNIFLVKEDKIITPPLNEGCINGVMRRHLLEQGQIAGFPLSEEVITARQLAAATEVFLTNAVRGILPVRQFRDRVYPMHQSHRIKEHLAL